MTNPIEQVLADLHRADVRYMVVGGVAVVLHGYLRATADLDLVIQMKPENIIRNGSNTPRVRLETAGAGRR